ncbi:acyl-ACP--UDP-N-acetylglucosamine O-acyltransferase [Parvularcula dongshanensis]|uniref:Acyl-[acyl-carrier-protein]--UDP-N-acetylglucosamine O-acyltransferase n=1 Tax=Parvularcula dongshanensis TaxID=1173995 RepID=A0A840I534_9PROT|nr:acyl-ACP--UDP-N-acetylglucosamine O-acyltransferase [Parvularcula dongshanensis]MBB4659393.1 UDP-N-acetylglucosamine acyltransferase [Parvularcula dongshanensis]
MSVHPRAIVEDGAKIGEGVEVAPFCHVGANVVLEDGVNLHPHATVLGHTTVGEGTEIYPFAVLGSPPQHLGYKGEPTRLRIGARNQIREHVTMHPGTVQGHGETVVGDDGLYMVGAHVAHDCVLGDHVIMANNATLGGHVEVGDYAFLSGLCAVHQFSRIGPYSFVGGGAIVTKDVIPYGTVFGNHAHLEGLNLVGMKRRGLSRPTIHAIRGAYRLLFAPEGTLEERIDDAAKLYGEVPEVMAILAFMQADDKRPLCLPAR